MDAVHVLLRPNVVIAIVGEAGTGKTWLLQTLLAELQAAGVDAVLLGRGDATLPGDRAGIVLVDEAESVELAELASLAAPPMPGLVLAGPPELAARLEALPRAREIALRTLRPDEAVAFVREQAAADDAKVSPEAESEIVARGSGVVRLLNGLLTASIFVASLGTAPEVTAAHVAEAVALRGEFTGPAAVTEATQPYEEPVQERRESIAVGRAPVRRRWPVVVAVLLLVGVVLAARYALHPQPAPRAVAESRPPVPAPTPVPLPAPTAVPEAAATPVAAPAPSEPALPAGVVPHVLLSYGREDTAAQRQSVDTVQVLRSAGVAASDPLPVLRPPGPGIAYFFADDAANAGAIGQDLDGRFGAGYAAALRPDEALPRPGTLELRLSSAGQPASAQAATLGDAPGAVTLVQPADGATVAGKSVLLGWQAPAFPAPLRYFVEVLALGPAPPQEVFGGYTAATAVTVPVDGAGRYAWRVLAVSRDPARYTTGAWATFQIGGTP